MKGTLREGSGAPGSGTGGGFIPVPQVAPGIVEKLVQPLSFERLLSGGVATSNTVRYAVEGTALSAAAGVAEGGNKPESTIAVSTLDEPIKKIATTLTASDELVDDVAASPRKKLQDRRKVGGWLRSGRRQPYGFEGDGGV